MSKHTPGPRSVRKFDSEQMIVLGPERPEFSGRRNLLATFTGDDREANALLDAAAPELLEACKRLRRRAKTGKHIQVGDVEALDAAIAKAQ